MENHQFNLVWVNSVHEIPIHVWNDCFPQDVEGYWWYQTLEQSHLENQFQFFYGILYAETQPIAIIPTFIMDLPIDLVLPDLLATLLRQLGRFIPSLLYQRAFFIGSPCADEGTIGISSKFKSEDIIPIIQNACEQRSKVLKIPLLIWKDFSEQYVLALDQLIASNDLFKVVSFPGTTLKLDKINSFDDYLKQLNSNQRHHLKKNLRLSHQLLQLTTTIEQTPDKKLLDEIFNLFWGTYTKGKTKFEELNKLFFHNIAKQPIAYFICLREQKTNKLVAFMLCFDLGYKIINKFIGIDYNQPSDARLYFRLWESALIWAIKTGTKEFQSGQTGYAAKLRIGNKLVPLTNYCKHQNRFLHWLFKKIASSIDWEVLDSDLKNTPNFK